MVNKLGKKEIEELEYVYLERIRYYFLDNVGEIIKGLNSRLEIKSNWYKQFMATKKNKGKNPSDLDMGAERIFHYIFSKGMKNPNSSPIGADLMYETYDAFVHIDIKTILDSNWGDYKGKVATKPNQTSYPLHRYNASPNLPKFYSKTFKKGGKSYYKVTLTYFIYILHKHASKEIYSILLVCMPNGELYDVYGDKILRAGKNKGDVRYSFKEEPRFVLLSKDRGKDISRVEFLIKKKKLSQEILIGISEKKLKVPVWIEI